MPVFENDVTESRIRRRHVIEAVDFLHIVVDGAPHNQPHDHFYAFRARVAQVFNVRNAHICFRVAREIVEETRVEFLVDEPCARSLQLMRQAARAEDDEH
jgi:hypothetical protein